MAIAGLDGLEGLIHKKTTKYRRGGGAATPGSADLRLPKTLTNQDFVTKMTNCDESIRHLDELFSSNLVKFRSQTLEGPCSAVSTPIFAIKYSLESS